MSDFWMTAIMGTCIFIATCIGGYFTGKLRLSGKIHQLLINKSKEALKDVPAGALIVTPDYDHFRYYACGMTEVINSVNDILDGKK